MENDNDIRKKEKKLNSNHWMCKIQKYTLGIDAPKFYMGYCPFFWVTVLCLFLFPFILVFRGIVGVLSKIDEWTNKFFATRVHPKISERREYKTGELRKIPLLPKDHMLRTLFINYDRLVEEKYPLVGMVRYCDFDNIYSTLEIERMALWFAHNPTWKETHYPDAQKRLDDARELAKAKLAKAEEKRKKREAFKRKLINKGAFCGKLLFKVGVVAAIAVLAVGIYFGCYKAFTTIPLHMFLQAISIVSFIGAGIVLGKIILNEIELLVENSESKSFWYKDYQDTELRLFFKPFGLIVKGIILIVKGIVAVVEFIQRAFAFGKEAIGMMYKEECPLILWGDETGPIEKRNKETNV